MNEIYLDGAATKPMDSDVLIEYLYTSRAFGYNPSSPYEVGKEARRKLNEARLNIAEYVDCTPEEIVFTSGGTEGNNMMLRGFADGTKNSETFVLITSQIEHPSILRTAEFIENHYSNSHVYYIAVDREGYIDLDLLTSTIEAELSENVKPENILISIQGANSEIGTKQDLLRIIHMAEEYECFVHSDLVQDFPHSSPSSYHLLDSFTVSGHKIGAPKNCGFVYISDTLRRRIAPLLHGGGHQNGLRSGTEDVSGAVCMSMCIDKLKNRNDFGHPIFFRNILTQLSNNNINYYTNGFVGIPVLSLTFPGVSGTVLSSLLEERGIYVSPGSACHSMESTPSHVLKAIGLSNEDARCTIRICHNYNLGVDEYEEFTRALVDVIHLIKG